MIEEAVSSTVEAIVKSKDVDLKKFDGGKSDYINYVVHVSIPYYFDKSNLFKKDYDEFCKKVISQLKDRIKL